MRSAVTLFLLVLMVSIQTPVGQLLKFPLLIEHFLKHQNKDGVALLNFLQDHYVSDHDDADQPEDERLPFKSISFYSIGFAIVPDVIKANVVEHIGRDKKIILADTFALQEHLGSIFHPPRG